MRREIRRSRIAGGTGSRTSSSPPPPCPSRTAGPPDRRNAGIVDQPMRMTFRVEDYDTRRGFRRHFRKAAPAGEGKGGEA